MLIAWVGRDSPWSVFADDSLIPDQPTPMQQRKSRNSELIMSFRNLNYLQFVTMVCSVGVCRSVDPTGVSGTIYCLYATDYRALEFFSACATIPNAVKKFEWCDENNLQVQRWMPQLLRYSKIFLKPHEWSV